MRLIGRGDIRIALYSASSQPSCARRARSGTVDCWSTGAAVEGSAVAVDLHVLALQFAQHQSQHAHCAHLVQRIVSVAAFR